MCRSINPIRQPTHYTDIVLCQLAYQLMADGFAISRGITRTDYPYSSWRLQGFDLSFVVNKEWRIFLVKLLQHSYYRQDGVQWILQEMG